MKKSAPLAKTEEIQYYLKDLKKIPVITHDREFEIFKIMKENKALSKTERKAFVDELVTGNLRFVISVAKTYQNQGLDVADLISEGNIGLIKAIDRYDYTSGYKFISYAVWWIKQSIMYALNEYARTIRVPSNVLQDTQKQKREEITSYDGRFSFDNVTSPLVPLPSTVDLFREINEEGDTLLELIPNQNADNPETLMINTEDLKIRIRQVMSSLDKREQAIIDGYFGLTGVEKNLDDLGEEFGCTKERIRQLKDKALKKLRNESYSLINYL